MKCFKNETKGNPIQSMSNTFQRNRKYFIRNFGYCLAIARRIPTLICNIIPLFSHFWSIICGSKGQFKGVILKTKAKDLVFVDPSKNMTDDGRLLFSYTCLKLMLFPSTPLYLLVFQTYGKNVVRSG